MSVEERVTPPDPARLPVLIIDDEPTVCEALRDSIEYHGYASVTAASHEEAMEIGSRMGWRFHAVLVDATMPGEKPGSAFASRIKSFNPAIRVLLMSGFSEESLAYMGENTSCTDGFLQKPIRLDDLGAVLGTGTGSERGGDEYTGPDAAGCVMERLPVVSA